jgi:hypothetical protein
MEESYTDEKDRDSGKYTIPASMLRLWGNYKNDERPRARNYFNEKGKEISPDPELIKED